MTEGGSSKEDAQKRREMGFLKGTAMIRQTLNG
jgi:hypothetical protein